MSYLLSIVVPTKDRYYYLKYLIKLIKSFDCEDIELVIQDNTENNLEIVEFLKEFKYSHLNYFHTKEQLSVSLNSDKAILHSTGEYICFIGDDDGVLPNIIDCVKWMKEYDIDALVPKEIPYVWPDYIKGKAGVNYADVLTISKDGVYTGEAEIVNSIEALNDLKRIGFLNRGRLPIVYHGIVARNSLDKIYERGKTYFPGASPDIANGVALCFFVNKYVRLDYPIIITGASKMHGGGIRKLKDRLADIDDVPFLPQNAKRDWEKTIPKIWAAETVWPESAIKALRYMGREDIIKKVNYNRILVVFIFAHPIYYKLALKSVRKPFVFFLCFVSFFICKYTSAIFRRVNLYLFKKPLVNGEKIKGLKNIQNVANYLIEKYSNFSPKLK
jgi:glycosyltransferase involved in cell wall biosynthesis